MFGIIKGLIDEFIAILFTGSILTFGVSETYFLIKKKALNKIQKRKPSLPKFTEALTCKKFDDRMNLVKITSRHYRTKRN